MSHIAKPGSEAVEKTSSVKPGDQAAGLGTPSVGADPAIAKLMRFATYASFTVAVTLIIAKTAAWTVTESVSLLSTLIDSILDAGASLVTLIAVHHALRPADDDHRFGHGKAEPVAGLLQCAFIFGSATFLILQAGERLIRPQTIAQPDLGYGVLGFTIVVTFALVMFQRYVVKRSGSVAIGADALHYKTDLLINLSVMLSIFLTASLGWLYADPIFAILIGLYLIWGAWQIGNEALGILMDKELSDEERNRIETIVQEHPSVKGLYDLRTRSSGPHLFIQLHMELDGSVSLNEAHVLSLEVERSVLEAFPNAEVMIHPDPEGVTEHRERRARR